MAKSAAMSFNLALVVSLMLLISIAEGRLLALIPPTLRCETVYGVKTDDTCFAIQKEFKLTPEEFDAINPNLICEKLFVGQWLCINGSS